MKIKSTKGNLTVFLSIFLPVFIIFLGVLTDITRMKTASGRLSESLYTSVDSMLTCYDPSLKETYGLYVVSEREEGIFYQMMEKNTGDILMTSHLEFIHPLSDLDVLKEQVLEDIKIKGLINMGKDFMEKISSLKGLSDEEGLTDLGKSKEEISKGLQQEVADNMVIIKDLEERRRNGETGLDGQIEALYEKNRELLLLAEDISAEEVSVQTEDKKIFSEEGLKKLTEAYGNEAVELPDPLSSFYEKKEEFMVVSVLEEAFVDMRDTLLVDEYILEHFEDMSNGGQGEVERILHGDNYILPAVSELFITRFFLDSIGYLTMDSKAPPEPAIRLLYGLGAGLATGIYDTVELLLEEKGSVPLIHMEPQGGNFIERIEFSYKNHLQLLMLFKSEEKKLEGIYREVKKGRESELYSGVRGTGEVAVDLFFLKYLPEGMPILDGWIEGGKFHVAKEVEKSY